MPGKAIRPLSLYVRYPATRWQNITVTKLSATGAERALRLATRCAWINRVSLASNMSIVCVVG